MPARVRLLAALLGLAVAPAGVGGVKSKWKPSSAIGAPRGPPLIFCMGVVWEHRDNKKG